MEEAKQALATAESRKERLTIVKEVATNARCTLEQKLTFIFGVFLNNEIKNDKEFPVSEFEAALQALFSAETTEQAQDAVLETYLLAHLDLLHYFLGFLCNEFKNKASFDHALYFELLRKIGVWLMGEGLLEQTAVEGEEDLPLFFPELSKKNFKLKKQFTKTWMELLKAFHPERKCAKIQDVSQVEAKTEKALNSKQKKQLITARTDRLKKKLLLHLTHIFKYLESPLILADFYLREFDRGSLEVQICALSGLLYLVTETQLEFQEDYYDRLYLLLRPEVFAVEYRVRFQRILAASLIQSSSLPGQSAACFAKKLLKICVQDPLVDIPSISWCVGLAYNIVRKNEATCKKLLHREVVEPGGGVVQPVTTPRTPSTSSSTAAGPSQDQEKIARTSTRIRNSANEQEVQQDQGTQQGALSSSSDIALGLVDQHSKATGAASTSASSNMMNVGTTTTSGEEDNNASMSKSARAPHLQTKQLTADPFLLTHTLAQARSVLAQTSLWELDVLAKHQHPLVSRLIPFFKNHAMFKKIAQGVDVNEFLDLTTDDLLEKELKHKRKNYDDVEELPGFAFFPRCKKPKLEASYRRDLEDGLLRVVATGSTSSRKL
ncbi:unnamed protein product [Amoebophrya sp. A120]|nr:unnamed protein product [Amoebophrya sp. A120]|eukprot:GSA120T00011164001.1